MPNTEPELCPLQVAVGVVKNADGNILIALRNPAAHQGGLWEFPGGKLEAGETAEHALVRELKEELNVTVHSASPLISINHQYPDLHVHLLVFLVEQFAGPVQSQTGQPFQWVAPEKLPDYTFPKANQPIITAARLPDRYAIWDDADELPVMPKLGKILARGVKLIQARLKNTPAGQVQIFMQQAYHLCQQQQALLLVNSAVTNAHFLTADGLHLTSHHLLALNKRPKDITWLAAACHNQQELQHAQKIGVDFVVLAPVLATTTHPDTPHLGWPSFSNLVADTVIPVYALGGMSEADLSTAKQAGAQGIAGISTFLSN